MFFNGLKSYPGEEIVAVIGLEIMKGALMKHIDIYQNLPTEAIFFFFNSN